MVNYGGLVASSHPLTTSLKYMFNIQIKYKLIFR